MSIRFSRLAIAVSALALLVTAGGFTSVSAASNHHVVSPAGLVQHGYLTVGSDETYPPMESQNNSQKAIGADVDLGNAIAKAMGLKGAKFQNVTFDDLIPELTGIHPFDVIMSSMNNTPGRRSEGVAFVNYLKAVEAILLRKGSKLHANGYSGVCGVTVSVETGTTEQAGLEAANTKCKKKINILNFDTDTEAYQALLSHQSDAYTTDYPVAALYVKEGKGAYKLAGKVIRTGQEYGIGIRNTDKSLIKAVKKAFTKVKKSGKYLKILRRYDLQQGAI